ncbi:MAG: metallophosphoesterase [Pirellulaceae bacterium]|jgi:alkaline phosphatase|nr:metallophosphoesterase [Pirellulaceae bacterium]MDP7020560.1 metallophosphoesterase [Pirellulaceae bacterium]
MSNILHSSRPLSRRAILRGGTLLLTCGGLELSAAARLLADDKTKSRRVRLAVLTDMHFADKAPAGSRHYRETIGKLAAAAEQFAKDKPEFTVELGDFIDAADSVKTELGYLKKIQREFAALPGEKHYVLGNHCVYTLTKQEFLDGVERKKSYYSFDKRGVHFVVLDACYLKDGTPYGRKNFVWTDPNIPGQQIEWLKKDLAEAKGKVVVFVHQRLDLPGDSHYAINNAVQVRRVLEQSGKVLAVLQGHSHKNYVTEINGIHYCVMRAMIEGSGAAQNGYSTMDVSAEGAIRITGFRDQQNYDWS